MTTTCNPTVRDAVYATIAARRDIRSTFLPDPVPDDVLTRILTAAHQAPSVGLSQPWDFVVIRDETIRHRVRDLALQQKDAFAASLPTDRAAQFSHLKIEGILQAPVNIAITCDPTRGGPHTLGRHADPRMTSFSVACAVQNLWLAARAEGYGVGWVSFFSPTQIRDALELPEHLEVVAYLCVGQVSEFPPSPELVMSGWARRRPLSWAVHHDTWGNRHLPGGTPMSMVSETVQAIEPASIDAHKAAEARQLQLTKPPGAMGQLEDMGCRIAAMQGLEVPEMPSPTALAVFAGDHGVQAAHGVSPWPQEVTAQMVLNFAGGGAVANVIARQVGAEVNVVDVGVAAELPDAPGLLRRSVTRGTADMLAGPALTEAQVQRALEVGIEVARDLVAQGNRLLIAGEVGIGNTTSAAALICAFMGADPEQVTGRGAGADDALLAHKKDVVRRALALHQPSAHDPVHALRTVGGAEIAAMTGFYVAAAALRTPVIIDGVIAVSAALAAQALAPAASQYFLAGHASVEPGSRIGVEALGLRPLLDLDLRLGEGTGALLAVPLVQSAVRILRETATFESAGVSGS